MESDEDRSVDIFCAAMAMKDKKRQFYANAMKTCPDRVGVETFKMLFDAESEHFNKIQDVYEELKKSKPSADACRFRATPENEDRRALLRKIAAEHGRVPKACLDDVAAIETGLSLEEAGISFFEKRLEKAVDPVEREFLEALIAEERRHYILLADLKFYYLDPEHWFMEKSRSRLDGAGEVT